MKETVRRAKRVLLWTLMTGMIAGCSVDAGGRFGEKAEDKVDVPPALVAANEAPASAKAGAPAPSTPPTHPAPGQAGMVVQVDEQTGELRAPTAEEAERLLSSGDKALDSQKFSDEGLVGEEMPNGRVRYRLRGRFQHATKVSLGPDGQQQVECELHPGAFGHSHAKNEGAQQ